VNIASDFLDTPLIHTAPESRSIADRADHRCPELRIRNRAAAPRRRWSVTGATRSADTLEKLRAAGADALEVDVTDQASVLQALQTVAERHGSVDLVVNAASPYGGSRSGSRTGRRYRREGRLAFSVRRRDFCASRGRRRLLFRWPVAPRVGRCPAAVCGRLRERLARPRLTPRPESRTTGCGGRSWHGASNPGIWEPRRTVAAAR
jgi:hypothetical protein